MNEIVVKGAHIHNLKNIDVVIPKNKLVVVTGVSGSGKSSLAFDILFEEGRKQYLQSLGILPGIDEEDRFESLSGMSPTIAVQQNTIRQNNPRSTVGSKTGILNLLAVLYSGEGQVLCSSCGSKTGNSLVCPQCGNKEERLTASCFSYNAPNGMCIKCSGRGAYNEIRMEKLCPDNETTLSQILDRIAITPGYEKLLKKTFATYLDIAFYSIPEEVRKDFLYGHYVSTNYDHRSYSLMRIFQGGLYKNQEKLNGVYVRTICTDCQGFRISEEARRVLLSGKHIGELAKMTIIELKTFLSSKVQTEPFTSFSKNLLKEIIRKIDALVRFHLGYLSLYREIPTLSGGEIQRLFLNSHLDSNLDSLVYILDEPTVGLHESEKAELLKSLKKLNEIGNSVIVVDHDRNTIENADYVIDIGPKAGKEGGKVVYQGEYPGLLHCPDSLTARYLSETMTTPLRNNEKPGTPDTPLLTIRNARTNNLKGITVSFPLGKLVGIAGLSGSGKSSLVSGTLLPRLKEFFCPQRNEKKGKHINDTNRFFEDQESTDENPDAIETVIGQLIGVERLSGYAEISQTPIGRTITSNPASYIGIWDPIRRLFAEQPIARQKNFSMGHFSFNSKGACTVCGGSGHETLWLGGNITIPITCRECHGKRYNAEALSIRYKDKNIFDVLEMDVSEAISFFGDQRAILPVLKVMERIGMGYIQLGQPTPTLSGGEGQRIKLAKEIGRRRKGPILYILDEPTTGLSIYDTSKLMMLMDELIKKGNSVIVVEHDPMVLRICDWIIELGPGSGSEGGYLVAEGTPRMLGQNPRSLTGKYL
jgi:excinuclease ABC A subunit